MSNVHIAIPRILPGLVAITVASAAVAQAPRSSLAVAASSGAPKFRDPRTGQVWTPETVGQDGRPLTGPDDKPSIRARRAWRPGLQSKEYVAGLSARCRSRQDQLFPSSPWMARHFGWCPGSAGKPFCI
jgi:hypothetical protein